MKLKRLRLELMTGALCLLALSTAAADCLLLPVKQVDGKWTRIEKPETVQVAVTATNLQADYTGPVSVSLQKQFTISGANETGEQELTLLLPLVGQIAGDAATVTLRDSGGKELPAVPTRQFTAEQAQPLLEELTRLLDRPELVAHSGRHLLVCRVPATTGVYTLEVKYRQDAAPTPPAVNSLQLPLAYSGSAARPARLTIKVNLQAQPEHAAPLRSVFCPTHVAQIERNDLFQATVTARVDQWQGGEDFRLFWVEAAEPLGLRTLAFRGENLKEDGFFLLMGNPTGSAKADEQAQVKDVIFVLDTSGSMRGEKIEQARSAIVWCLEELNPGDRFNVVTFGSDVTSFREELMNNSAENLEQAIDFVEGLVANGRTNISGALAAALKIKPAEDRPQIVIFLTDGTPTAGELSAEKIVKQVEQQNTAKTKVFVIGLGHDVNAHLLDLIAEKTLGSSEYVTSEEEVDTKIAALYNRLAHPVLDNVAISFGKLPAHDIFPRQLPVLFKGTEMMVLGRYREGGEHTFTVSGTLHGKPVAHEVKAVLPTEKTSDASVAFVAPLWANRKIGFLLQEMRLHGENQELLEEVVRLSQEFGIVTEYTAFISSPTGGGNYAALTRNFDNADRFAAPGALSAGELPQAAAIEEAREQLRDANFRQTGAWAVNRARNDQELQSKVVVQNEANFYYDRRGKQVKAQNIQQQGAKTFYCRGGQWVDAEAAGERKTRQVKLYSDEYFELLRKSPEFANAQKLSWAVSINVGDERIVVEKDGKTTDESLTTEQAPANEVQEQQEESQFRNRGQLQNRFQQNELNQLPALPRAEPVPAPQLPQEPPQQQAVPEGGN